MILRVHEYNGCGTILFYLITVQELKRGVEIRPVWVRQQSQSNQSQYRIEYSMIRTKNIRVRPQFTVEYQPKMNPYNAFTDRNLQEFFGIKENMKVLRKTGLINRKGQILDQRAMKNLRTTPSSLNSSFRLRKPLVGRVVQANLMKTRELSPLNSSQLKQCIKKKKEELRCQGVCL